jgi:hypothetical protein
VKQACVLAIVVTIGIVGISTRATPQSYSAQKTLFFYAGRCDRLSTPHGDQTAHCGRSIISIFYASERHSFAFVNGADAMISFTGVEERQHGSLNLLSLDAITIAKNNREVPVSIEAKGFCKYGRLGASVTVDCRASTQEGQFAASFRSDGKPPSRSDL